MLVKKIDSDLRQSMKQKDSVRVSTLRMLKAAANNRMIELGVNELKDSEVIPLIRKDVKRHEDSIEQFKKGGRPELAEKEAAELEILKSYLPNEPSREEIKELVKKTIDETGAAGKKDFGKVMKQVMGQLKGAADGKIVSSVVNEMLKD